MATTSSENNRYIIETLHNKLGEKGLILKKEQNDAIEGLLKGIDVLAVLPTGFGKSAIYQSFLLAEGIRSVHSSPSSALVVVPLRSIIEEQLSSNDFSMNMTAFGKNEAILNDIRENKFQVVYASAEEALSPEFLALLKDESSPFRKELSLIVVDECHTVTTWGISKKKGKKVIAPFRKEFGLLSNLRSFCSGIPILALTGTANEDMKSRIIKELTMKPDTLVINIDPDRPNIRFNVIKTSKKDHLHHIQWLVNLIKKERENTPKTIIFCNTIHDIAKLTGYLFGILGDEAYASNQPHSPANRLIGIYHSMTLSKYKARVSNSLKTDDGNVRIVVATSALSMGVNFPDVKYIIHMGPARTTIDHIQEVGRAGRNGEASHNIVIYYGNQLTHCEKSVKDFCKSSGCIRKSLFKDYTSVDSVYPLHSCCSNCALICKCNGQDCKKEEYPFDIPLGNTQEQVRVRSERNVMDEDRKALEEALFELKCKFDTQSLSAFGSSSSHGFSNELINTVVMKASTVFCLSDLLSEFPIFNISHAKLILEVFNEIFEDVENLEELMDLIPDELYSNLPLPLDDEELLGFLSLDIESDPDEVNMDEMENI